MTVLLAHGESEILNGKTFILALDLDPGAECDCPKCRDDVP